MDYLYILGRGSRHGDMELRWALRSLEKYGRNVGRVIVAGYPPMWLDGKVRRMRVEDKYDRKHKNIARVLLKVAEADLLDGRFVLASDDVFYSKVFDADRHPFWMKERELPTAIPKGEEGFSGYWNNLIASRKFMVGQNMPTINFSTHANMLCSVDALKKGARMLQESIATERGVDGWVLAGALYKAFGEGSEPTMRRDVKVRSAESVGDVERQIGDGDCFSISDTAFMSPEFLKYMHREYPRVSAWED